MMKRREKWREGWRGGGGRDRGGDGDGVPSHFDRKSGEIGSFFGGARVTGVLGSNLPAMVAS